MYHVDVTNIGDYSFNVQSKDHRFIVDTKGKGMMPPEVFLASLGSCIGVYLRKYAEGAKLNLSEFSISVDADLSKNEPVCFRKIELKIDLKGAQLDDRRLKAIHEFVKNCPIHNTIKSNPEIEIKIS
jgi:putative redox protein